MADVITLIVVIACACGNASVDSIDAAYSLPDDLFELLVSYDDPIATPKDIAYLLVTHGYDARPERDYVVLYVHDHMYRLYPHETIMRGRVYYVCSEVD